VRICCALGWHIPSCPRKAHLRGLPGSYREEQPSQAPSTEAIRVDVESLLVELSNYQDQEEKCDLHVFGHTLLGKK
jgi:hypothetical protein